MTAAQPIAIINARLLDPASDYDGPGAVLIENGRIVEDGDPARLAAAPSRYAELLDAERTARQSLWQGRHWRALKVEDCRVRDDR